MKTINYLFLLLVLSFNHQLISQSSIDLPESWKSMLKLEGLWAGPCNLILDNKSYQINYSFNFKSILNGLGMQMEEDFQHAVLGSYQGYNLIGYDPYDKLIHWFSVDNMGTTHDHTIRWINEGQIQVDHTSIQNGKKYTEQGFIKFSNNHSFEMQLITKLDNKTMQELKGILTKQNKKTMN